MTLLVTNFLAFIACSTNSKNVDPIRLHYFIPTFCSLAQNHGTYEATTPENLSTTTTMKSPSQTQNTSTNPTTLTSSSLQALAGSNGGDPPDFPINMTNTASPESEAVHRRRRLRMILNSAIALLDDDDFDPIESPTTHQRLLQ
jgi:hypothetical protein